MEHPFLAWSAAARQRAYLGLIVATVAWMLLLMAFDLPIRNAAAPNGIVSLELAWTVDESERILGSWTNPQRLDVAFGLGLDFVFLALYSTALAVGCLRVVDLPGGVARGVRRAAAALAWALWGAGALDACENFALFRSLSKGTEEPWPLVASSCASLKFAILAVALLALVALSATRRRRAIAEASASRGDPTG